MSTDMSQFYQIFFEEAAELLAEKENLLLGLDLDAPDSEQLNAIFRAAHSIKGGASTFGFTDMTEVTHVLESLLDRIRKGEMKLTGLMVDAFLNAADVLKAQLAGHRDGVHPDPAAAQRICQALKRLASGEQPAAPAEVQVQELVSPLHASQRAPTAGPVAEQISAPQDVRPVQGQVPRYQIEFTLAEGVRTAMVNNLRANLSALGKLDALNEPAASVVSGAYAWRLETDSSEEDIWEALAFVVNPAALKIEREGVVAQSPSKPNPADTDYGFFEPLYDALVPPKEAPAAVATASIAQVAEVPEHATSAAAEPAAAGQPVKFGRRESDKNPAAPSLDATSIRVGVEKVDQLINLVGELVITQAMLAQTVSKIDPVLHETLVKGIGLLERNTRDLQESVMSIRMMPIGFVFSRFPRVVRDLASKLSKEVELKTVGEGTELDKGLIEKIADPLNHLVRNSIDHGIEAPEKRRSAGKPAKGTITLRAFHHGGNVVIEVSDDGAGLNRDKILEKARSRGMAVSDAMSDQEVWQLIFEAGFSTAEVVTDVSGRGVGMDVVRRNIQALGGSVEIDSALGTGTRISIRLPLTLAILDGLSVTVGDQLFIVPLTYIVESLQPKMADVKSVRNQGTVVHVRGEYLPVLKLHEMFNIQPKVADIEKGIMVILESDGIKKALFVDELIGQHQVVIKSLETNFRKIRGISGATIMGDGKVALIIDAGAVVRGTKQELRAVA
ncbi:MAG: chemotaxis protein CheA [Betaproteobacteria bacterium]|nr:chemotaxis protein CheA [Betaproteobacteria bacterium]